MELSILQTDFVGSPQLLSQDSIIDDKNNCIGCSESDFQKFFNKANEGTSKGINNNVPDKHVPACIKQGIVADNANSEITTTDSMEISASLFLSILGINPDIAKLNSINPETSSGQGIDLKSIGNKDLESITAVDFLKNLGFSEDNARGIVAQVVNTNQQLEGIGKANDNTQILSQIDYAGSLNKNILPEGEQRNIPSDSVQIQKSLEDIKNIVSDKLDISPSEIESQLLQDKQDVLDRIFNKESVKENLKISNGFIDNSLRTENEDVAINDKDVKVSHNLEMIDKKKSSPLDNKKATDSDSLTADKSFPENREVSVKYISANTGLKGFDSVSTGGTENISQSSKASLSNSVINQIVENAQIVVKGDKKEIKIHLDPPSLGSIQMKVTVESHSMKVTAIADTHYVKEVIESNLNELKRSLADSGIKVEQFSVFVGHGYNQDNTGNTPMYHTDSGMPDVIEMADMSGKKMDIKGIVNNNLINIFV
ncbi:MAG: flagellar hook-length control protein FliK [Nitrospinae bacterium]|nr:flagellar hook-length control protein FliK [Nitrospinota bacterium]